jgi:hypothetical protein
MVNGLRKGGNVFMLKKVIPLVLMSGLVLGACNGNGGNGGNGNNGNNGGAVPNNNETPMEDRNNNGQTGPDMDGLDNDQNGNGTNGNGGIINGNNGTNGGVNDNNDDGILDNDNNNNNGNNR